jgi:hypothetical protein
MSHFQVEFMFCFSEKLTFYIINHYLLDKLLYMTDVKWLTAYDYIS